MNGIKIKFESNQEYQINAVNAVTDLFEGRTKIEAEEWQFVGDDTFPNADEYDFLSDCSAALQENLFKIQNDQKNNVPASCRCIGLSPENDGETLVSTIDNYDNYSYPEFIINMETGTGKTYVYLRTIYELQARYGFSKFIIIVPSVAIFEGVVSTFKATLSHFTALYGQSTVPDAIIEYDGKVEKCKYFATANYITIMVMTIDSFNKASNVIYKSTDKIMGGKLPINYIQEARPILILDEVQNYRSGKSLAALRTLHPYFSIGYSATPGNDNHNLLYKLSSFDALQLNLVKKIEIYGIEEEYSGAGSEDYIRVNDVQAKSGKLEASVELQERIGGALKLKSYILHQGESLTDITKNPAYGDLTVTDMRANDDDLYLELSNGKKYFVSNNGIHTLTQRSIFRQMIHNTIQTHLEKKRLIEQCGYDVKVLSLFFIDRVASFNGPEPLVKNIFDEEFESLKYLDPDFQNLSAEDVRCAYFAKKKDPKTGTEEFFDSFDEIEKKARDSAEKEAYNLIMKGKEELLSKKNQVCFIFAHSALREGWDNPNVFQICTLREIKSENARRQTIGRGLRLPVDQNGDRIRDKNVNLLTVIADESYADFVKNIQSEYEEDGTMLKQMFKKRSDKKIVNRIDNNFRSTKFSKLWSQMNQKTSYVININTDNLIRDSISKINKLEFTNPKILTSKAKMVITKYLITVTDVNSNGKMASILLETADSNGKKFEDNRQVIDIKKDSVLNKNHNYLSKFKVVSINYDSGPEKRHTVSFKGLQTPFELGVTYEFDTTSGQHIQSEYKFEELPDIPKCNLLERTEKEVPLTRKTILSIFKGLDERIQMEFIKNPEGFVFQFIAALKDIYADHIADNIKYSDEGTTMSFKINGEIVSDDTLFLEHPEVPISEMEDANKNISIYDIIQVDSEVERKFVRTLNAAEYGDTGVILYFKFPSQYKILMPKIIGNYNPDWAITYKDDDGMDLYLVRETKGTEDPYKLWHPNERRKIECAKKHYKAIGVRYRVVDDKDPVWYLSEEQKKNFYGVQLKLFE